MGSRIFQVCSLLYNGISCGVISIILSCKKLRPQSMRVNNLQTCIKMCSTFVDVGLLNSV